MSDTTHLHYLLNNIKQEFISSMNKNFIFTYMNSIFKRDFDNIFGTNIQIGDCLDDVLKDSTEYKEVKGLWERAINGEEFSMIDKFGDTKILTEKKYFEINYFTIKDEDGNSIGAGLIGKDVTEREQLRIKAEESMKIKSIFLSSISHELRTPMNAILGFSQLIEYDVDEGTEMATYIDSINRSGKYLLGLINNILDLNKINNHQVSLSYINLNIVDEVNEIYEDIKILTKRSNISFLINLSSYSHINIYVDPQRYRQIMINLISNAIKYNKDRGEVIIRGEIDTNTNMFYTIVEDTGIGISKKHLKNICIPFNRLGNETSQIEGSGLGLSITKNLVEIMNGELKIESVVDVGSTFSVGFKMGDNTESNIKQSNKKQHNGNISINYAFTGSIIYVEDNNFNLFLMEKLIEKHFPNCKYSFERNGRLGFQKICNEQPDIALLDVNLPDMSGTEILKGIKNNPIVSHIKCIMITANLNDTIRSESRFYNCDGFITKPIIIPSFMKIMSKTIEDINEHKK